MPLTLGTPVLNDSNRNGFWSNVDGIPKIHRARDRVFVGAAVDMHDTTSNNNSTWLSSSAVGASWALRDAQFVVQSDLGQMSVVGISRSSDNSGVGTCIGVSGLVIGDRDNQTVWALYSDVQLESGTGRTGWGCEFAVKNKGANVTSNPFTSSGPYGACGIWFPAGGDGSYGGSAANNNNFAIGLKGISKKWNTGILFLDDAITRDGNNVANAIHLSKGHRIAWASSASKLAAGAIWLDPNAAGTGSGGIVFSDNLVQIQAADKVVVNLTANSSSVNYFSISASTTGNPMQLSASGSDTDIDLKLVAKGAGKIRFGTFTTLGSEVITGYITIKDDGGTTRKVAVIA